MNNIRAIQRLNDLELSRGYSEASSWHQDYSDSAYVHVSGLSYDLTEGDILAVFSQYGTIVDLNVVRDRETGKSKGFAFIGYENQKSTNLVVDNFNGITLLGGGRKLKVDHCKNYKRPESLKRRKDNQEVEAAPMEPFRNLQDKLQADDDRLTTIVKKEGEQMTENEIQFDRIKRKIEKKIRLLDPNDPLYASIVAMCRARLDKERLNLSEKEKLKLN